MRIAKSFTAWMICLSLFFLAPMSLAGEEPVLIDGSRAAIIEKQLVLTDGAGKRSVARPGIYDTRDGRYRFIVRENKVVVRDHTQELR